MIAKFKHLPLFWQLVIPLIMVGTIFMVLTSYTVIQLNRSISLMDDHYSSATDSILNLNQIQNNITRLRTLTLKHMATETAVEMTQFDKLINMSMQNLKMDITELSKYLEFTNKSHQAEIKTLGQLTDNYDRQIQTIMRLSNDFEKEQAFTLFNKAEKQYLKNINVILRSQTRENFIELKTSHQRLEEKISLYFNLAQIFGIINVAILLLISFIITRRFSDRLTTILGWSRQFSHDVNINMLPVFYNDEIGNLSLAINDMAQRIRHDRERIISAKKLAENNAISLKLYENIFNNAGEAILVTDKDLHIIATNKSFMVLTGYSFEEINNQKPTFLLNGRLSFGTYREILARLNAGDLWQGEIWARKENGIAYPIWVVFSSVSDQNGAICNYLARFTDISERKNAEDKIQYLAHHDSLTGLLNRFSLEDCLAQAIYHARRQQVKLAVMFIDLDRFKVINDTYGHDIGDLLLVDVARRLRNCLRESDILARLGGDEFVVALTDLAEARVASQIITKISEQLSSPYSISGHSIHTSSSIGASIFPDDGNDPKELMKHADSAMYLAKEAGRDNYQFFSSELAKAAEERSILENDFQLAIQNNQFELYYQPQFAIDGIQLLAFEALIRWHHPVRGMIPPNQFIKLAEDGGFIEPLGAWVLNEACRQLSEWRNNHGMETRIAINLSARQLRSSSLINQVMITLEKYQLPAHSLELEVTETVAMNNPELAKEILSELSELGVTIVIDDFGTGYSSFSYLKRLPINALKLDQSYVHGIANDPHDMEISAAIIQLAHNLGIKVTAEGVESEVQFRFMQTHNCDLLQGYLFSKPLTAEDATELLSGLIPGQLAGGM